MARFMDLSIPGSGKDFYIWSFMLLLLFLYVFCPMHIIFHEVFTAFGNVNLFSMLNILQILWPI